MRSRATTVLPPSRLKEKRRKLRFVWLFGGVSGVLLLIGGVIGAFYIPAFQIRDIEIEGDTTLSDDVVADTVRNQLHTKLFFVLPRSNILLYSEASIISAVKDAFPKFSKVSVNLQNLHALHVQVEERSSTALWCGLTMSPENTESCYFLDDNGFVYEPSPLYSGSAYVRMYGPLSGKDLIGSSFLTKDEFRALLTFIDALKAKGHTVVKIYVDDTRDVQMVFEGEYRILFTRDQKLEDVLTKIETAQGSSVLQGKSLQDLQYLDLRFGNRLYYKWK